jgi:hypothetical protein
LIEVKYCKKGSLSIKFKVKPRPMVKNRASAISKKALEFLQQKNM